MKRIIFENIKFISFDDKYFAKILKINGLFVFPSAPGLASIDVEKQYYNSLKKSDLVFLDSGLFVLRFARNQPTQAPFQSPQYQPVDLLFGPHVGYYHPQKHEPYE